MGNHEHYFESPNHLDHIHTFYEWESMGPEQMDDHEDLSKFPIAIRPLTLYEWKSKGPE